MEMAKTKLETELEAAAANAAAKLAKADDPAEAAKWQGIVNQSMAALDAIRGS